MNCSSILDCELLLVALISKNNDLLSELSYVYLYKPEVALYIFIFILLILVLILVLLGFVLYKIRSAPSYYSISYAN